MIVKDKKKKSAVKKRQSPLVVKVKTTDGKTVSMKQITPSEINALRNPAYEYLA